MYKLLKLSGRDALCQFIFAFILFRLISSRIKAYLQSYMHIKSQNAIEFLRVIPRLRRRRTKPC